MNSILPSSLLHAWILSSNLQNGSHAIITLRRGREGYYSSLTAPGPG